MPKICRCFSFDDIYQCKPTFFSKKCYKGNPLTDFEKTLVELFCHFIYISSQSSVLEI